MTRTPDDNAFALTTEALDPLRYDGHVDDPAEVAGIMQAAMPSGARVLDVGCGPGSLTIVVNRGKNNDVVGVEPDPDRAKEAQARGLNVFARMMDRQFFDEHGKFDVIIFADVLEHMVAPAQTLIEAAAGLNPEGQIIASVPNVAHWSVRLNLLRGRFDYEAVGIMDATHLRWFTAKTLHEVFESTGFEVVSIKQCAGTTLPVYSRAPFNYVPYRILKPLIRLGARLLPLWFGSQHVIVARRPRASAAVPS